MTQKRSTTLLLLGILLIAANLRAPITALPPLLETIQSTYGLGNSSAGALTALPLLAFALLSPVSASLSLRLGLERTLLGALMLIGVGIALRSVSGTWALFSGTCLIGMGIAAGNVLLPGVVKRDFPNHIAAITGAYALTMGLAAALGSALVVPLASLWGWPSALFCLMILPLSAGILWLMHCRQHPKEKTQHGNVKKAAAPWRAPLAWHITLFLGLNSTIYYVAISWLPAILTANGMSSTQAGSVHGIMQLATAVPGLLLSPMIRRLPDQRLPAVAVALFSTIALVGLIYLPSFAVVWSALFGVGTGAGIILGLSFIGMRSRHSQQAASLSGMSQCIGYLLAALGPILMAQLHDALGSWEWPLLLCAALSLIAAWMGYLAGRNVYMPE